MILFDSYKDIQDASNIFYESQHTKIKQQLKVLSSHQTVYNNMSKASMLYGGWARFYIYLIL